MPTGYEIEHYQHVANIDRSLNRIANCLEANEKRARERESGVNQLCGEKDCSNMCVVTINGMRYCADHLDAGFARVSEVARKAMRVMGPEEGEQ